MDKDKAAAFIEEKRKEKGLTQQQVAEALHVTRQAVSKWEQGKSLLDVDTLLHLAELFQVPVEALLGEEYTAPAGTGTSLVSKRQKIALAAPLSGAGAAASAAPGQAQLPMGDSALRADRLVGRYRAYLAVSENDRLQLHLLQRTVYAGLGRAAELFEQGQG